MVEMWAERGEKSGEGESGESGVKVKSYVTTKHTRRHIYIVLTGAGPHFISFLVPRPNLLSLIYAAQKCLVFKRRSPTHTQIKTLTICT